MSFFEELKRRNVIRVSLAYIVAAWLILQLSDILLDNIVAPPWVFTVILLLLGIGLVLTVFFAWAFELTPDGVMRAEDVDLSQSITPSTGKKLNALTIAMLAIAVVFLLWDKFDGNETSIESAQIAVEVEKSIAVLPLRTRSNVEEDDYFADGIHDDLLTQLAKLSSLDKVISRTSTERYRDTTMSMQDIGAELGVATILEGGVQRAGTRVRINMQLIDAATDEHLWADTYERELTVENLFAIQSEITREVVNALHVVMSDEETQRVAVVPTNSLEANREYALGRRKLATRNGEAILEAERHFEAAVSIDPNYADAWVGLADTLLLQDEHAGISFEQNEDRIQRAIDKALALDPSSGKAYTALANATYERGQREEAERHYKKAIELSPNYATAYHWYSLLLRAGGRRDEAMASIQKAIELDPLAPILVTNLIDDLSYFGRSDEAQSIILRSLETSPDFAGLYSAMGFLRANAGHAGDALRWHERAVELNPGHSGSLFSQCLAQIQLGLTSAAEDCRDDFESRFERASTYLELSLYLSQKDLSAAHELMASLPEGEKRIGQLSAMFVYYFATQQVEPLHAVMNKIFSDKLDDEDFVVDASSSNDAVAIGFYLYMDGQIERANDLLDQSLALMADSGRTFGLNYKDQDVYIHALRGDIEKARQALREFIELRIVSDHWMYDTWVFEALREDPEAAALLKKLDGIVTAEREWYLSHKDEPLF